MKSTAPNDRARWKSKLRLIDNAFQATMARAIGCGPFDGGCLIVAQALQSVLGGELYVLVDKDDYALHAAVMVDGILWDFDGPLEPAAFLESYNGFVGEDRYRCVSFRVMEGYDLTESMEDDKLASVLANMLRYIIPQQLRMGDGSIRLIIKPSDNELGDLHNEPNGVPEAAGFGLAR